MEVECIGNTQIIHMEETEITQRTIGLIMEGDDLFEHFHGVGLGPFKKILVVR